MKPKQILLVVAAFAILGLLYWRQQSTQRDVITEGLGYEQILTISKDAIGAVKCYHGRWKDEAVHLVRADETWKVKSRFDTRARQDKVDSLLEKLTALEGAVRSTSSQVLPDYGLDEENALHLEIFNRDGHLEKHLLIGNRAGNHQDNFIRTADSSAVYPVGQNLRGDFGFWGETNDRSPDNQPWVDLTLLQADRDVISEVKLIAPHREIVLNLIETAPESVEDSTEAVVFAPETVWTFIEPPIQAAPLESGLNRLLSAFSNVSAAEVIARGGLEQYGLDPASSSCSITRKDGRVDRILFGNSVPGTEGAYYVRQDEDDLVYRMDAWKIRALFPDLNDLTTLTPPSTPASQVQRAEITTSDRTFTFARQEADQDWALTAPEIDLALYTDQVQTMVTALAEPRIRDQATHPRPEVTGLDQPEATARLTLDDGRKLAVHLGKTVPMTDSSRFYRIDDEDTVWVVPKTVWRDAVPKTGELFDLTLTDFDPETITQIRIEDASGELNLSKPLELPEEATAEIQWQATGLIEKTLDESLVLPFLSNLSHLLADALEFEPTDTGLDRPPWKVVLTTDDGETVELSLGNQHEAGGVFAKRSDKKAVFILGGHQARMLKMLDKSLREAD